MQNGYTKEGQLSWWLAFLECLWIHKGRGSNPLPFKTQKYFNFYLKPAQPAQLEGPRAGPRALDLPTARPVDQSKGSVARHGPYSSGPADPARWRPLVYSGSAQLGLHPLSSSFNPELEVPLI